MTSFGVPIFRLENWAHEKHPGNRSSHRINGVCTVYIGILL